MEDSILDTIKSMLGIDPTYDAYDVDVIIHINSVLSVLNQLGVGPNTGFRIHGSEETWGDFIGEEASLEFIKDYIYMKVKMAFDPPESSSLMSAYKDTCSELEWRINVSVDKGAW